MYRVETTQPIMDEMARYEGSTVVSKSEPVFCPPWCKGDPDLERMYTRYHFTVRGECNRRRWASFSNTALLP